MSFHKNKESEYKKHKIKNYHLKTLVGYIIKGWSYIIAPYQAICRSFFNLNKRLKRAYSAFVAKESEATQNEIEDQIIALITELYRFNGTFERMLTKISEDDVLKYKSKYKWFSNCVFEISETIGVQIVDLNGKAYDMGLPVTALNLDDYNENDLLIISQMLEPILMRRGTVLKVGTVMVGKKNNDEIKNVN